MQTSDFYASTAASGDVIPLGRVDTLTPFGGAPIGAGHVHYSNFKAGAQPKEKFDIQGMDSCPQDPQCGQQQKQLRRLAARQWHTFAAHVQLV